MSWLGDTYTQTVTFWAQDNSFDKAVDTVAWSVTPQGAQAVGKAIDKSISETEKQAKKTVILYGGLALFGVLGFYYLKAKARKYGRE